MAIEQRIEEFFRHAKEIWKKWGFDSYRSHLSVSNPFACSLFLLVGLEATIFTSTTLDGPLSQYSNRVLGHDLSGVGFGIILTVFTQFSMMLGAHVLRFPYNGSLQSTVGFGLGNMLLALMAFPTVLIAPDLYTLLLVEIFVSMMLLVVRICITTMPRIRQGAVA